MKYQDEVVSYILFILLFVGLVRSRGNIKIYNKKKWNINFKILISIVILFFIGIIGNVTFDYQNTYAVIADIILVFKGFVTYIFASMLFERYSFKMYYKFINNFIRSITVIIFLLDITNYITKIYPIGEMRIIPTQELFFSHPTYLASFCVVLMAMLLILQEEYNNIFYIIIIGIVAFTTQRNKVIIFLAIFMLLYYLIIIKDKRIKVSLGGVILVLAIFVGYEQISTYLSNPEWARTALMSKSVEVANDHFPIGSGFGTFATWNSGVSYSPLYYTYGLSNIWGLSPNMYNFVGDTYWPAIIAQFGYIGFVLIIYIISQIYKKISLSKNKFQYMSQISILIYLLILSTSETSFMSPVGPILCLVMAIEK
ncbi:MAG: hypothetical protein Q4Q23_07385 [Methanobacteriaceae archaeon]|nr:hypothetical protein [Methanobacteriaceae archaeon]